MQKVVFLGFLIVGAYMDYRSRELDVCYLITFAIVGSFFSIRFLMTGGKWAEMLLSCSTGAMLLGISHLTGGAIGEGDGWFFLIAGLFLTWKENFMLLCGGWFLCFLYSLLILGWSIGKRDFRRSRSVPFLPFLVLAGIYLVALAG